MILQKSAVAAILWGPVVLLTPLYFLAVGEGVHMCTDPHFLLPCCYRPTWPVIHSVGSADSS